ncbi:MAG: hypothetical protein ACOYIP_04635 [Coriobacteriales bacterium]|jgi:hypothetical protein
MASFDKDAFDIKLYLDAARKAAEEGRGKLAFHLYLAAYEVATAAGQHPSDAVLDGMREAWDIAMGLGDKPAAELVFAAVAPLFEGSEVDGMMHELQDMMVSQLKDMGVSDEQIEQVTSLQYDGADEDEDEDEDGHAAPGFPDFLNGLGMLVRGAVGGAQQGALGAGGMQMPWGQPAQDQKQEQPEPQVGYHTIVGYDTALKSMRAFGFDTADDEAYRQFVQESSVFHGLDGLSLYDPFLFYGPSREDVFEFAEATAGEIGNPVLVLHVRTNDEGVWTIRLSGPFRRGLFGMSDPTDIPTPCTFIIENIDILQDFIRMALEAEHRMDGEVAAQSGRMYSEIIGYIHTIVNKPEVFPILTAQKDAKLTGPFAELFGRCERILVDNPTVDERKAVWNSFAMEHTSFSGIDIDKLSTLSEGISRHNMVVAGKSAVKEAYQESLTNNDHRFVTINDVLFEMVPFASDGDKPNTVIEDAAAEAFINELGDFDFGGGE